MEPRRHGGTERFRGFRLRVSVSLWFILSVLWVGSAHARVNVVTLPGRDSVQLTIYNSADLTLVKETRFLTFRKGLNKLEFSWANTLIDPTSVRFDPVKADAGLEIVATSFPKESGEMLTWSVEASSAGDRQVIISYFTSGISWSASYDARVNDAGDSMRLTGYVTVTNQSGAEYEDAQVRLIIGSVHLVEDIRTLAQRAKWNELKGAIEELADEAAMDKNEELEEKTANVPHAARRTGEGFARKVRAAQDKPKEVEKESIGEYFMYTVEGTETIRNGWSKRMTAIKPTTVKTAQVYYWKPVEFGHGLMRVIEFKNTKEHGLAHEPLPGGNVQFYADSGEGSRGYLAGVDVKYVPYGEEAKWNLGADPNVSMKVTNMKERRSNLAFDNGEGWREKRLIGWDHEFDVDIALNNRRANPITVEVHIRYGHDDYVFTNVGKGEKEDAFTTKWREPLAGGQEIHIPYSVTFHNGTNAKHK